MSSSYRAIAFDYGGVIELLQGGSMLHAVAEVLQVPYEDFQKEYFAHNHLANAGNLSWNDMIVRVAARFDSSAETRQRVLDEVDRRWSQRVLNSELIATLPKLRNVGLKLAIFSNWSADLHDVLRDNGVAALVDEVVASGDIGFQKPQPEAFHVLFERLAVLPAELIFVDDSRKSLETAPQLGYTPIRFETNEQLFAELRDLGVSFE